MKKIHNILVVIEKKQMRQPALERALALYNYAKFKNKDNTDIDFHITAVLPLAQEQWNITSFLAIEQKQLQEQYIKKQENWLNAYLSLNAMGVDIDKRVIYSKQVGKDIVDLAKELSCDLLIKTAELHGILDSVLFTPLDWQMLRHSPVPVYIAKDHLWQPSGTIAVAIDSSDDDGSSEILNLTNLRLLREAQKLAKFTGCKLALINAVTPFIPPVSVDVPSFAPDAIYERNLKDSCKRALEFAKRHKIAADDCHISEGRLDEVIYSECKKLNPTALFIGTSARRGIASALIGNICEKVTDDLSCDVVVLTPKTVVRSVPTITPSKNLN